MVLSDYSVRSDYSLLSGFPEIFRNFIEDLDEIYLEYSRLDFYEEGPRAIRREILRDRLYKAMMSNPRVVGEYIIGFRATLNYRSAYAIDCVECMCRCIYNGCYAVCHYLGFMQEFGSIPSRIYCNEILKGKPITYQYIYNLGLQHFDRYSEAYANEMKLLDTRKEKSFNFLSSYYLLRILDKIKERMVDAQMYPHFFTIYDVYNIVIQRKEYSHPHIPWYLRFFKRFKSIYRFIESCEQYKCTSCDLKNYGNRYLYELIKEVKESIKEVNFAPSFVEEAIDNALDLYPKQIKVRNRNVVIAHGGIFIIKTVEAIIGAHFLFPILPPVFKGIYIGIYLFIVGLIGYSCYNWWASLKRDSKYSFLLGSCPSSFYTFRNKFPNARGKLLSQFPINTSYKVQFDKLYMTINLSKYGKDTIEQSIVEGNLDA